MTQYLHGTLDIIRLEPDNLRYYLPAYLYAMADSEVVWQYLGTVLDHLWYEDEDGVRLYNDFGFRVQWEQFTAALTDRRKKCVAHCLVRILESAESIEECGEVHMETDRIEYMLEKYWGAWLQAGGK